MDGEYVLCNWKGRLWPAKVLSRSGTSPKSKREVARHLEVQILSLDEKIKVKSKQIQMLTESQMEAMASSWVARSKFRAPTGEERAHRKALNVALEILEERARLGHSSAFHKEETNSLSQRVPQETSRALPPRKFGKRTGEGSRSHGKNIEFSKFPVVSLVRCDALCGDEPQKHAAPGPVLSETEPKSSPSSRVGHRFPSLSEGGDEKEGKKKADTSAVMSSHPTVVTEGACAKHQEGIPVWPSGTLRTGLKALVKAEVQDACPKTRARSRGSSAFSENTEGPREGPSKPSSAGAATRSSSSNLRLTNRKRKLQIQGAQNGLKKRPPVDDSEATGPVKSKSRHGPRQGQSRCVARPQEPCPTERGMVVWFKFQDYPYWPAVVVSVQSVEKTARVLLIEAYMSQERRGIRVPLRRLKPLDCEQKPKLMNRARKLYGQSVDWCCSLVAHYREAVGHRSFVGSFLEYFAADISYPIRKAVQEGEVDSDFPRVNYNDLEESEEEPHLGGKGRYKKLLPDRMKAARDRGNQKLLDFIVKRKGAERHLLDIVDGRKQSTWLDSFLGSARRMACIETYLEDEDQLDVLVRYLQEIYEQIDQRMLTRIKNDKVNFVLEVLLPEAIICSISALEGLDYKDAEAKYLNGPPVHYREKELFDRKALVERRRRLVMRKAH
ncbi:PWWP domain-containing DNA repair factor 3B-like [Loxodonta africana]|uniref:PWWP domain-containing DNA repair factor 3B-like n=1 Tax=Loxodonta africana TaxID=9785 RepID=UPI0002236756|nr:PWWP domain-containing protein MUM1L1-like [Loxodonta africana]